MKGLDFNYCRDAAEAVAVARFFCANLTRDYISHAELMGPRAIDPQTWSPDIGAVIEAEFAARLKAPLDATPGEQTLLGARLLIDGVLAGAFMITFSRISPVAHCVLEDIVIDANLRGEGLGSHYMAWVEGECRKRSIGRLFLESGLHNDQAHHFFERQGFATTSVVMMKELP